MALFELPRAGGVAGVARGSHVGRFLPLYLAGLAAGAGLGLALTFAANGNGAAIPRVAPGVSPPVLASAPRVAPPAEIAFAAPAQPAIELSPGAALNALPELPQDLLAALFVPAPATEPVSAPAVVPVAPPVAAAPVAPAAPGAPVAPAPVVPAAAPAAEAPPVAEQPAAPAAVPAKPNFYVPEPAAGGVTALEQRLLDGLNAERAAAGLAPYAFDQNLSRIARIRVQQLVDQNYFGHTDPYGYSMYVELLAHFGYTSYAWAGENLAMNNYGVAESPERAVAALMRSPTHKANILAGDFFRIGIGELTTPDGRHFYAMIFLG